MLKEVRLPKVSLTMEEGRIVRGTVAVRGAG